MLSSYAEALTPAAETDVATWQNRANALHASMVREVERDPPPSSVVKGVTSVDEVVNERLRAN